MHTTRSAPPRQVAPKHVIDRILRHALLYKLPVVRGTSIPQPPPKGGKR